MKEHQSCIACNHTVLSNQGKYLDGRMVKCENCNLYFAKPIPTAKELKEHYDGYGRNDYLSPITIKRYHELLDGFEKYRKTNRLIDVGCGIGYFAEIASQRGWDVYGTEFTDEAIDICSKKGIKMHQGELNTENYKNIKFDIITSFEVVEHINNPQEEFSNFYSILRKGGLVYITTPNFNSISRFLSGPKWTAICYPEHLTYYTSKTLKNVLKNKGFSITKTRTTGFSITRHKIANHDLKSAFIAQTTEDEKLRNKTENVWYWKLTKNVINAFLSIFKTGDTIKIYGEKG